MEQLDHVAVVLHNEGLRLHKVQRGKKCQKSIRKRLADLSKLPVVITIQEALGLLKPWRALPLEVPLQFGARICCGRYTLEKMRFLFVIFPMCGPCLEVGLMEGE
jgi:hypothetical protein